VHVTLAMALPGVDPVQKVSTIPRGVAELGYTIQLIESVPSAFDILSRNHVVLSRNHVVLDRAAQALLSKETLQGPELEGHRRNGPTGASRNASRSLANLFSLPGVYGRRPETTS
jgi:ATP-dependent Zn protease